MIPSDPLQHFSPVAVSKGSRERAGTLTRAIHRKEAKLHLLVPPGDKIQYSKSLTAMQAPQPHGSVIFERGQIAIGDGRFVSYGDTRAAQSHAASGIVALKNIRYNGPATSARDNLTPILSLVRALLEKSETHVAHIEVEPPIDNTRFFKVASNKSDELTIYKEKSPKHLMPPKTESATDHAEAMPTKDDDGFVHISRSSSWDSIAADMRELAEAN